MSAKLLVEGMESAFSNSRCESYITPEQKCSNELEPPISLKRFESDSASIEIANRLSDGTVLSRDKR